MSFNTSDKTCMNLQCVRRSSVLIYNLQAQYYHPYSGRRYNQRMALQPFMFNDGSGRMWSDPFGEGFEAGARMPSMETTLFQPGMSSLTPMLRAQRREMTPFRNILRADLIENSDGYEVHCDLPGCDPSDLDLQIVDDTLVIKAERSHVHSKDTDTVHTMERSFGQVSRTIKLPKDANLEDVKTEFNHGVLNVTFSKKTGVTLGRKLLIN